MNMIRRRYLLIVLLLQGFSPYPKALGRDLSVADRVRAQEIINRVYYSYQASPTQSYERFISPDLAVRQVRRFLISSAYVERARGFTITPDVLEAELKRISSNTKFPDRLRTLYSALGNDSVLIQECFVRPQLVERLARSFFATDDGIHGGERRAAHQLRQQLIDREQRSPGRGVLSVIEVHLIRPPADPRKRAGLPRTMRLADNRTALYVLPDEFARMQKRLEPFKVLPSPVSEEDTRFVAFKTLESSSDVIVVREMEVLKRSWDEWSADRESAGQVDEVAAVARDVGLSELLHGPDPGKSGPAVSASPGSCTASLTWTQGNLVSPPIARTGHTAVWTGSMMLIWGGERAAIGGVGADYMGSGGKYDPLTDSWLPISLVGAPSARSGHTGVWTGNRLLIWGGYNGKYLGDGGAYDPISDAWSSIATVAAPSPRTEHTAVWTGSLMLIWGGWAGGDPLYGGARYDPILNSWTLMNGYLNAPNGKRGHTATWTGTSMLVWGGIERGLQGLQYTNTGRLYDPGSDIWLPIDSTSAPSPRAYHTAAWSGRYLIVWGGYNGTQSLRTGGRYDPLSNTWKTTTLTNAPVERNTFNSAMTRRGLVIWGSPTENPFTNLGSIYDDNTDQWFNMTTSNAPTGRVAHSIVSTDDSVIVWGGYDATEVSTGARYNLAADSWTPTNVGSKLEPRRQHSAVWTGNQMIVWGGRVESSLNSTNTGSMYDPLLDSWTAITTDGAPSARDEHAAAWTGTRMIIWGGSGLTTGGLYDPMRNMWEAMPTTNAPIGRSEFTSVWADGRLIVWGGDTLTGDTNTGGIYNPTDKSWTATSLNGAPTGRENHGGAWSGTFMFVWGGIDHDGFVVNTGGRFYPTSNTWSPVSTMNAPTPRDGHVILWTGTEMLVLGGEDGSLMGNPGGRYDPARDQWRSVSTSGAPLKNSYGTGVWTGHSAIIWGGADFFGGEILGSGGWYDPTRDAWVQTPSAGAPVARWLHAAVWTDQAMLVWGGANDESFLADGAALFESVPLVDLDGDGFYACTGDCNDSDATVFPGAPQICDGKNNDCLASNWPLLAGTNEVDQDGDSLSTCMGDCDDASPQVWATPGEVENALFLSDTTTLNFAFPTDPGAVPAAVTFDVLRSGSPPTGPAGACATTSVLGTSLSDPTKPALGQVLYYLPRARNACPLGTGTLGFDSNGVPRAGCVGTYSTTTVLPTGGTVALSGTVSAGFGVGNFAASTGVSVSTSANSDENNEFLASASLFGATRLLPYELRIITNGACPTGTIGMTIQLSDPFLSLIPVGASPRLFAKIFQDGGDEVLDSYQLFPSQYDGTSHILTANVPSLTFTQRRRPDGKCEAVFIVALISPGSQSAAQGQSGRNPGASSTIAMATDQRSIESDTPYVMAPWIDQVLTPSGCMGSSLGPPLLGTLQVTGRFSSSPPVHYGTDFEIDNNVSTVRAMADGTVVEAGYDLRNLPAPDPRCGKPLKGWGRYLVLEHLDGSRTLYAHLKDSDYLPKGSPVNEGDMIGIADATGCVSGPHLHVEYAPDGMIYAVDSKVDPYPCIGDTLSSSVTVFDNGALADDAFSVAINGNIVCTTEPGGFNTCAVGNLKSGNATLTLTVLLAPDDVGTYEIRLADGVTFQGGTTDESGVLPQGGSISYTIIVP